MADEGRARKSPNSKDSDSDYETELEGLESDLEEDELDVNPPSFSSSDERDPKYQSDDDEGNDDDKHSQPFSSDEGDPKSQSDSDSESDLVFLAFDKKNRKRRPLTSATAASSGDPMLTTVLELLETSTSKQQRRQRKEAWEKREERRLETEREFDFPIDEEKWREEDLMEMWRDAPFLYTKPGWDPWNVDLADDYILARQEMALGQDPPSAPFYVPYQKYYPVIPSNHPDIKNAKQVVEEFDRIEEFLNWVSYIFPDGSSYEGTVWDDLAHGKGVYVADHGLLRYEGEWFRNMTEGHGVLEYDIPHIEPVPGSKLEAKMRAQGKIIKRDFMSPEDREWLEMDIEDSFAEGTYATPVHRLGGVKVRSRRRYAGEWKHNRMHGCGVIELDECAVHGRFYFGDLLEDPAGCDENISAMHAGIAEVAAAKARMFVNKPDGMVREYKGPYSDPQHPYLYEEEDVWMAPGFINQFYEVPDYWKEYAHEVDQEREMWLNSFYRAPLRLPMPAELEHWWSKEEEPEFVVINGPPKPDPENPTEYIYPDDPIILHTPTGQIIDYVDDEEHGIRLFWRPQGDEDDVDPEKVQFLPLGFDEFYGRPEIDNETSLKLDEKAEEVKWMPLLDEVEKWTNKKKEAAEKKLKLIEKELELGEAELSLQEEIEDTDEALKRVEKEEERKLKKGLQEEEDIIPPEPATEDEEASETEEKDEDEDEEEEEEEDEEEEEEEEEEEDEEEDEDEDEDDVSPLSFGSVIEDRDSSFGSVIEDRDSAKDEQKENKPGKSPFSSFSLSLASCSLVSSSNLVSMVPPQLQQLFSAREGKLQTKPSPSPNPLRSSVVSFPHKIDRCWNLRATRQPYHQVKETSKLHLGNISTQSTFMKSQRRLGECKPPKCSWPHSAADEELQNILSLHTSLDITVL